MTTAMMGYSRNSPVARANSWKQSQLNTATAIMTQPAPNKIGPIIAAVSQSQDFQRRKSSVCCSGGIRWNRNSPWMSNGATSSASTIAVTIQTVTG